MPTLIRRRDPDVAIDDLIEQMDERGLIEDHSVA